MIDALLLITGMAAATGVPVMSAVLYVHYSDSKERSVRDQ